MTRSDAKAIDIAYIKALSQEGYVQLIDKIYDGFESATSILLSANEEEIHRHFMECEKFKEQLDMEKRKAYLDGSNDCFKALKEAGKLK